MAMPDFEKLLKDSGLNKEAIQLNRHESNGDRERPEVTQKQREDFAIADARIQEAKKNGTLDKTLKEMTDQVVKSDPAYPRASEMKSQQLPAGNEVSPYQGRE